MARAWSSDWQERLFHGYQLDMPNRVPSKRDGLKWRDDMGEKLEFLVSNVWESIRFRDSKVDWRKVI